jgi:hypothetical protein
MRLVQVISFLLSLFVTGKAISIDCHDVVVGSCTDFCLSPMGNHVKLGWYGIECMQSPCNVAALADEALATTDSVDYAKFYCNRLKALPDFTNAMASCAVKSTAVSIATTTSRTCVTVSTQTTLGRYACRRVVC